MKINWISRDFDEAHGASLEGTLEGSPTLLLAGREYGPQDHIEDASGLFLPQLAAHWLLEEIEWLERRQGVVFSPSERRLLARFR